MNSIQLLDQLIAAISNPAKDIQFGWMIVEWMYALGFFIYLLFAVIIIRQIQMMSQTFTTQLRGVLLFFAFVHLLVATAIFGFSLISLL